MAKDTLNDYSATASLNTDVGGTSIAEGCSPANINNAIREVMSDIAAVRDGTTSITNWYMTSGNVSGTLTVGTLSVTTFSPTNLSPSGNLSVGGNATITGTLAAAGTTVTTLTASGAVTTASSVTATTFIPTGSSAPSNGVYLAAANSPAIASNTTERVRFNASGAWGISGANYGTSGQVLTSGGSSAAPSWSTVSAASGTAVTATYDVTIPITGGVNFIMKGGKATITGGGPTSVTFPVAFPSACIGVYIGPRYGGTGLDTIALGGAPTASGFSLESSDSGNNQDVYWQAVGI